MEKYNGYITFIKDSKDCDSRDSEFIKKYTKKDINVGEKIHSDEALVATNRLEESFHALSSMEKLQDWDNLIFAKVSSDEYTILDRFYYIKPAIMTNDIEVKEILNKKQILDLIKSDIESRNANSIEKYIKFIKFDENEKEFLQKNAINGFKSNVKTAISYYQDGNKNAYEEEFQKENEKYLKRR